MRFSTAELARHLGGALVGPDVIVDGAGIDSRTIAPRQLFVPVVAERDGHAFIGAALAAGAAAYLTQEGPDGATAVVVEDTATALMNLGVLARSRVADGVVGITGSVGKMHPLASPITDQTTNPLLITISGFTPKKAGTHRTRSAILPGSIEPT